MANVQGYFDRDADYYDNSELWTAWVENVDASCELLRANDPSMKSVRIVEQAARIMGALRNNTVVEALSVHFQDIPHSVYGDLNAFVRTSTSLKELKFNTGTISEFQSLQLVNLLLFAISCRANRITSSLSVPLCQSTVLSLSNALGVNQNLQRVSFLFLFEPSADPPVINNLVRNSLAPHLAQALSTTNLRHLTLDWSDEEAFSIGEDFLEALPGCLPPSLQTLEFRSFEDSETIAEAVANMIEQSGPHLDEICFFHCMFEDENSTHVLHDLQSKPNLKALYYDYLTTGTAPVLAQSIGTVFQNLEDLGVGFHDGIDGIEAFEVLCEQLPLNTMSVKVLDIKMYLHDDINRKVQINRKVRFLRSLASAITKLPNLRSITCYMHYHDDLGMASEGAVPLEFLASLSGHEHLISVTPGICCGEDQPLVDYYLKRNRFRDRLAATKPIMVEAFQELDDDDPNSLTLVKDTLISRNDWLTPGLDQGEPLPTSAAEEGTP